MRLTGFDFAWVGLGVLASEILLGNGIYFLGGWFLGMAVVSALGWHDNDGF